MEILPLTEVLSHEGQNKSFSSNNMNQVEKYVNEWLCFGDSRPLRNVKQVFRDRDKPHPTRTWTMLETSVQLFEWSSGLRLEG